MIGDIATIIWKEFRENIIGRQGSRGGVLGIVVIIAVMGAFIPYQMGADWLTDSHLLLNWSWIPIFLALSHVTDSFAGERERGTLETLLSTRLSDKAILFGKLLWVVLYAWLITLSILILGAIVINVAFPTGSLQFYPIENFALGVSASFMSALLISCIGVLVSFKAATAKQAYQRMSLVFIAVWFIPLAALQVLPKNSVEQFTSWLSKLDLVAVIAGAMIILLVLDVILVMIVNSTFKRAKLILS